MKKSNKASKKINELLIGHVETEKILLSIIDDVDNTLLKNFLRVTAYERNQLIKELDANLRDTDTTPIYPESTLIKDADLTNELKIFLAKGDSISVLNRIGKRQIRGIERYKKLLNKIEFNESAEKMLNNQLDKMITSLYSIEIHKDLMSRTPMSA